MKSAPDELGVTVALSTSADGQPVVVMRPVWSGDQVHGMEVIGRLQRLGKPIRTAIAQVRWGDLLRQFDAQAIDGRHYVVHTRWLDELAPEAISVLIEAFRTRSSPFSTIVLQHFHGHATRIAADATAFGLRREHFMAFVYTAWEPDRATLDAEHHSWASRLDTSLAPLSLPGGYANLLAPNAHEQIDGAYGANGRRLREIKRRFDPDNLFSSAIPLPA